MPKKVVLTAIFLTIFVLSAAQTVRAQEPSPPPSQPPPAPPPAPALTPANNSPVPPPVTDTTPLTPNTTPTPNYSPPLDLARDLERSRIENEASARQRAILQRKAFIDATIKLVVFRRAIAVLPVGSEALTAAAMKNLVKQSEEVQKQIPRIIEYLGGKKVKSVKKVSPPWETSTDAVIELLSALRRVNPELEKFARNEHVFDAGKSQVLISELQVVQHLLQQLQQTF